jgi:hypothetical protein
MANLRDTIDGINEKAWEAAMAGTGRAKDADILAVQIDHPFSGEAHFERVKQDRRTYYRLVGQRVPGGALTDAKHARESIAYWRTKGWIANG